MLTAEQCASIASLKPGIHYRPGTRRPYRPCPPDFRDTFLRIGWSHELVEHYRTNWPCIYRWIEESGGDELREARAAGGQRFRTLPQNQSQLPSYAEAVAALSARSVDVEAVPGGTL